MAKLNVEKLKSKRERLQAQLKELEAQEQTHLSERHEIIGRAILTLVERDPQFREQIMAQLDQVLTAKRERQLLGLPVAAKARRRPPPTSGEA